MAVVPDAGEPLSPQAGSVGYGSADRRDTVPAFPAAGVGGSEAVPDGTPPEPVLPAA
jgi:hypothetical protein